MKIFPNLQRNLESRSLRLFLFIKLRSFEYAKIIWSSLDILASYKELRVYWICSLFLCCFFTLDFIRSLGSPDGGLVGFWLMLMFAFKQVEAEVKALLVIEEKEKWRALWATISIANHPQCCTNFNTAFHANW